MGEDVVSATQFNDVAERYDVLKGELKDLEQEVDKLRKERRRNRKLLLTLEARVASLKEEKEQASRREDQLMARLFEHDDEVRIRIGLKTTPEEGEASTETKPVRSTRQPWASVRSQAERRLAKPTNPAAPEVKADPIAERSEEYWRKKIDEVEEQDKKVDANPN